jgi:hypothetical protein
MDQVFGDRAQVAIPPGVLIQSTDISIDVFQSPLSVPMPRGFSAFGSRFVNIDLNPHPAGRLPSPGLSIVIPLVNPMPAGSPLTLYRIDPLNGNLIPAVSVTGGPVTGVVSADGLNATFSGIGSLSTVVGLVPAGGKPGDLNGDGVVDCDDLAIVRASFGRRTGQQGFDPRADVNNNGVVDVSDLAFISRQLPAGLVCASSATIEQMGVNE